MPKPDELISLMAAQMISDLPDDPVMVGIHTGGVWVARLLHNQLNLKTPLGSIDISFYKF